MTVKTLQTAQSGTVRIYTVDLKTDYSGLARQLKNVPVSNYWTTQDQFGNMVVTVKDF